MACRAGCRRRRLRSESGALERLHEGSRSTGSTRDQQRRLGQSITGIKSLLAESTGSKPVGEPFDRRGANGFGTVEGQGPRTQIQQFPLRLGNLPHTEVIREIRPPAGRRAVPRDRRQPPYRLLKKMHRRHQDAGGAEVEGLQHIADQPHVVIQRQPPDDDVLRRMAEGLLNQALVMQQIGMTDHHALRKAG